MKEIEDYIVLQGRSIIALRLEVKRSIRDGYVPQGGIAHVCTTETEYKNEVETFSQAMVKYETVIQLEDDSGVQVSFS